MFNYEYSHNFDTHLNRHGYSIPKHQLTEKQLEKLKEKLTASPKVQGGYSPLGSGAFPIYLESPKKIYLPRYYGLENYGMPKVNKIIETGITANLKFDGSLRPYQINIANIYLKAAKKVGGGIISIGCGRGKTVIGLYIAAALNLKTLVVVHKEFLAEQWKERILGDPSKDIKGFLPTAKVGLLQGKIIDVEDKDIVIAMVQSLSQKDYSEDILKDFGLVIYDECHHLSAEIFSKALIKTATRHTLGLSATPIRKDGLTYVFKYFLGDTVYSEAQNEDKTILVKGFHYFNDDPNYCNELTNKMGDLNRPKMINNICSCEKRNQIILEEIKNLMDENRKVLILSDRKEHLKYLMEQIEIKFGDLYYVEPEVQAEIIQEPVLAIEPIEKPIQAVESVLAIEPVGETIQEKKKREKEENKIKEREEKKKKKLEEKEEKKRKEKEEKEEQKRKDIEDGIDVFLGKTKLHGKICGLYVGGMKQTDLKISEDKRIILGTYPMVSEGFDCPTLDSVILASPKSDVIQSVGRIMRKKPEDRDRQHLVIDVIDYFGNFAQQWETRKKYYKKQKYQFDEYSYDDNSVRTVVSSGAPPPRKHKTFREEIQEVNFIDNDNDNLEDENEDNEEDED